MYPGILRRWINEIGLFCSKLNELNKNEIYNDISILYLSYNIKHDILVADSCTFAFPPYLSL